MAEGAIVLDQPWQIELFQLTRLRYAMELEMKGLKNSRGSVYGYVKRTYGFKGNRQKVLERLNELINEKRAKVGLPPRVLDIQ